ncbi:unnamed protein product [Cuscuta europaea]|uniref:Uncharacterized protein n=1 Tax=Cuscuta europaea TaxID=41803 RepID=A0A9P0YXE7_CUSEU|nr:unnamed protein product [Cuscuta europaea]
MSRFFHTTWAHLCKLIVVSRPVENLLLDGAKAVANRVSIIKDKDGRRMKACCPVCLMAISVDHTLQASDLRMSLAIHLRLYHPDDINLIWEVMHNRRKSSVHMPSFFLGVGMAAGVGALSLLTKNWARPSHNKR